ncbi:MAG TPA: HNH endonuclease [Hyphomicrobiaceae bacterium]|nr:HNH endonuclease [Hyphomicrobiaceae bacterium]
MRHYKPQRYCSLRCATPYKRTGKRDPRKHASAICPTCNTAFEYYRSWPRTYCSDRCKGRALVGNTGQPTDNRYTTQCESCGAAFETIPSQHARFCSQRCFGEWQSRTNVGPNNALWRGGSKFAYGPSWGKARKAARARDQHCVDCGAARCPDGRALHVHHLIPFRLFGTERHAEANVLSNLVTLCAPCHMAREWATNWRRP